MNRQVNLILCLLLLAVTTQAQQTLNLSGFNSSPAYDKYKNGQFHKVKRQNNKYQNQGMYHSSYYYLNPDSSFVYYSVFEVGYKMTFGTWSINKNEISLEWDSVKTYNSCKDSSIYNQYYSSMNPKPFKIKNKRFVYSDTLLTPVGK